MSSAIDKKSNSKTVAVIIINTGSYPAITINKIMNYFLKIWLKYAIFTVLKRLAIFCEYPFALLSKTELKVKNK